MIRRERENKGRGGEVYKERHKLKEGEIKGGRDSVTIGYGVRKILREGGRGRKKQREGE